MRRLQCRARPLHQAIDIRSGKLRGGDVERLLALAAPHRDLHMILVGRGSLHLAKARHHAAIDREQQIALLQALRRRGAADQAHHGQRLAPRRRVLREPPRPALRQADLARSRQRQHPELGLERVQRALVAHPIEHIGHQVDRHAARILRQLAAALVREARPGAQNVAGLVGQYAVEFQRRIDELHGLDIAVAEAHGARQRQLQRIDARDLGPAGMQLAVTAQSHHPHRFAGHQFARRQPRGPHRRAADQRRIVGDDREVVLRMDVHHAPRNLHGAGEGHRHVADRHRHGVAIDHHQAPLRIHDQAGAVIVALGDP